MPPTRGHWDLVKKTYQLYCQGQVNQQNSQGRQDRQDRKDRRHKNKKAVIYIAILKTNSSKRNYHQLLTRQNYLDCFSFACPELQNNSQVQLLVADSCNDETTVHSLCHMFDIDIIVRGLRNSIGYYLAEYTLWIYHWLCTMITMCTVYTLIYFFADQVKNFKMPKTMFMTNVCSNKDGIISSSSLRNKIKKYKSNRPLSLPSRDFFESLGYFQVPCHVLQNIYRNF